MITEERFWTLLVEANPIPDAELHESGSLEVTAHLTSSIERSSRMSQTGQEIVTRRNRPKQGQRNNGPRIKWLAAAVAVVTVGIAAFFLARTFDTAPVADSPLGIADTFLDAQNRHDGAKMAELTAADADVEGFLVGDPAEFELLTEFERSIGWQVLIDECMAFDPVADGSVRVFCTFDVDSDWSRALDRGPIPSNNVRFVIDQGKIQYVAFDIGSEIMDVQRSFQTWLSNTHPEDEIRMFREEDRLNPGFGVPRPLLTAENISLFARYTEEYLAARASNG